MTTENLSGIELREAWKPIPGYVGRYEASDMGRVRSITRRTPSKGGSTRLNHGRVLTATPDKKGYLRLSLSRGPNIVTRWVHQLILEAFVGAKPDGMVALHANNNPADNRLLNLSWGTPKQNSAQMARDGRSLRGERNPTAKLRAKDIAAIIAARAAGATQQQVADQFGVDRTLISKIERGFAWTQAS